MGYKMQIKQTLLIVVTLMTFKIFLAFFDAFIKTLFILMKP